MRRTLLVLLFLALTGSAAADKRLSMADGGQLTLERSDGDALAGRFVRDNRVAVFRSTVTRESLTFELRDSKNTVVLLVRTSPTTVMASLFGDRLVVSSPRGGEAQFEMQGGAVNEEAINALRENEAYLVMPNLAIELVHLGIVGDSDNFPAAQFIHGLAVTSAREQGLEMPALRFPESDAAAQPVALVGKCQNLKGNPNKDGCYGMCGNGCTCWWPVCGTCCGCEGCHTHDWACRITGCKEIHLTAAQRIAFHAGCVTFAAFFVPLTPCSRYETGAHHPPCPE